jgi:hypothetical protein
MVFNDTMRLGDGKGTVEIIHFPHAHTDGDAVVHFKKADIYHMGDIFVTYGLPFIAEDNGGDIYGMIRTIDYLLSVSNTGIGRIADSGRSPVCSLRVIDKRTDLKENEKGNDTAISY